ncbi:hypothetical protein KL924_002708 [Ogataea haglerorum]|nr:hypothetical protein KL924_002708 [Ogataea haglerorum]
MREKDSILAGVAKALDNYRIPHGGKWPPPEFNLQRSLSHVVGAKQPIVDMLPSLMRLSNWLCMLARGGGPRWTLWLFRIAIAAPESRYNCCTAPKAQAPVMSQAIPEFTWMDDFQYDFDSHRNSLSSVGSYEPDLFEVPDVMDMAPSSSPTTSPEEEKPEPSTTAKTRRRRKSTTARSKKPMTVTQRKAHNKIERKYRININSKIANLQKLVPWMSNEIVAFEIDAAGLDHLQGHGLGGRKLNKSMILDIVTKYIEHLKTDNESLRKRVFELEGHNTDADNNT